jgi:flagellar hook protein FlgE
MLDSIHVGVSGLLGYQQGLRVIANNTANLNTPGYKSSTLQFADLFHSARPPTGGEVRVGNGLDTTGTHLNFRQGDLRQTGNEFDLAVDGDGMFMVRDAQGQARYTRAGQFTFDAEGALVRRADGAKVQGIDAAGNIGDLGVAGMRTSGGRATTLARFTGNLSSTLPEQTVSGVKVLDRLGGEHLLSLRLTNTESTQPGSWKVELLDGSSVVASSEIVFVDGQPTPASSKMNVSYTPAGGTAQQLVLDFSSNVTSFAAGSLSTLAMTAQDGYLPGNLSQVSFDAAGALVATYSNGQTAKGARLALGRFSTADAVEDLGNSLFGVVDGSAWQHGAADEAGFGAVRVGVLEMSNVDLSREFSELVVMQRGYQASSQVISTANDMLQELFGMKRR